MKRAATIWTISFVLGAVVLAPLFNAIGIQFENVGFQLSVFLFQTLAFLLTSIVIHIGLRRYRVNSQIEDTFLIYSVVFGSYYPVLSVLNYPALALLLSSLKASKAHGAGLVNTVAAALGAVASPSSLAMSVLITTGSFLGAVIGIVLVGVFATAVAGRYLTDRQRVLNSLSFSMGVLVILPAAICSLLYYYVLFSFS